MKLDSTSDTINQGKTSLLKILKVYCIYFYKLLKISETFEIVFFLYFYKYNPNA